MSNETEHSATPVGVVGVGAMGGPITVRLVAAGRSVRIHDNRVDVMREVAGATGAAAAANTAAIARDCPIVLVVVDTDSAVRSVVGKLLPDRKALRAIVVCSSVHPTTVRELAADCAAADVRLLDCAMIGGIRGVRDGSAAVLVGGDETTLAAVRPALEPWSATIHHIGPVGAGQVAKAASNLVHWAQVCAIEEAMRLVDVAGLSVPTVRRALMDGPADSRALREIELMRLTWWRKDLDTYRALADELGAPQRVAELCRSTMPDITVDTLARLLATPRPSS
ncbi:MAG TPA: NAD(P)-binding domain-containing protein [Jatrophihabitans sp.]|jgi:3-hydroxyisobutyrate dehydrogenase-like beta-hydroxyacid dehydrogenase|nr:NAD(P)-binding domain-containing protein [Jatrophihabitans sp.]